jgi:hypothetical protein
VNLIEVIAAMFVLTGTLLLATKGRWAGWGFVAFLGSNASWLVFASQHNHQYMFIQQVGFTISSLLGIWVWLIKQPPQTLACFTLFESGELIYLTKTSFTHFHSLTLKKAGSNESVYSTAIYMTNNSSIHVRESESIVRIALERLQ